MKITPEGRSALDRAMNESRLTLGVTWRELAVRAGLSYEALRNIRQGSGGAEELTLRKIDTALGWPGGRAESIATSEVSVSEAMAALAEDVARADDQENNGTSG